jgi:hypothetical protein
MPPRFSHSPSPFRPQAFRRLASKAAALFAALALCAIFAPGALPASISPAVPPTTTQGQNIGDNKTSRSLYPKRLFGDDFDGIPCKIRLSQEYASDWKGALKKMRPSGLVVGKENENVIGASVKLFFKKERGKTAYYKSTDRTYEGLKNFFSLEKDYEKSIYIGMGLHSTGRLRFSEVKKYIHPDSTYGKETPYLQNEEAYKKHSEDVKKRNINAPGKTNLLAIIRFDIEDKNYLIYVLNRSIINKNKEDLIFYGGACVWDGRKWLYRGMHVSFDGDYIESLFYKSFQDLIRDDKESIKFEFSSPGKLAR